MQRIGKSGGVQGINEQTSQARSLLSRRRTAQSYRHYGSRGIQCVFGTYRSAQLQRRSLGLYPDVGIVNDGLWHELIKGLPDMTAHPL
jgi:hypothetical protein